MIKIDRNSWHYNVWDFMKTNQTPTDLCQYVRGVLLGIAIGLFVLFLIEVLLITAIDFPLSMFLMYYYDVPKLIHYFHEGTMALGAIAYFGLCIWLLFWAVWLPTRATFRATMGRKQEPTLVGHWIRAKKSKICPLIEVE